MISKTALLNLFASTLATVKAIVALTPTEADDEFVAKVDGYWEKILPFIQALPFATAADDGALVAITPELGAMLGLPNPEGVAAGDRPFLESLLRIIEMLAPIVIPLLVKDEQPAGE